MNFVGLNATDISLLTKASTLVSSQISTAIYKNGITDFNSITNMSLKHRADFSNKYSIHYPAIRTDLKSKDGTRKWLFALDSASNKSDIETVFIPDKVHKTFQENDDIGTLCISSQVGCALACTFCFTGTQKFSRNLLPSEIVGQVMYAMKEYQDFPQIINRKRTVNNIVLMGQGEPLLNYKNVKKSLEIITKELNYPAWRITLSTSGIVPLIESVGKDLGVGLAISLHATTDELRNTLVPINKSYNIKELMGGCERYLGHMPNNKHKRITFEYVMLKDVNDSIQDAKRLVELIQHLPCHVNLIPWNPWDGSIYQCSLPSSVKRFKNIVEDNDIACTVRVSRGQDIMAACGQLKSNAYSKRAFEPDQLLNELS